MNKKLKMMLMLVLACSMSAMAQSNMSSDSSAQNGMSGKKMSMTGCVSEKDGKYMLMTKKHPDGIQLMNSDDLKPHVGHEIMVMGTMQKMDASGGSNSSMSSGDQKGKGMMQMNVSSMKMVSETCSMMSK